MAEVLTKSERVSRMRLCHELATGLHQMGLHDRAMIWQNRATEHASVLGCGEFRKFEDAELQDKNDAG